MLFDDPSRILRIIRFASWFDLIIAPEIEEALNTNQILVDWLIKYVSAEKAGVEFDKIMGGWDPAWSVGMLLKHKIIHRYLTFPKTTDPAINDE